MEYPRVLIIAEQFGRLSGGAITLRNLFAGWPRERMALVNHCAPSPETRAAAGAIYLLGRDERRYPWPLSRFARQPASGPVTGLEKPSMSFFATERRVSKKGTLLYGFLKLLGVPALFPSARSSRTLEHWIQTWQPQVLYGQPETWQAICLLNELSARNTLPLVIHQMDDWQPVAFGHGPLAWYYRRQVEAGFRRLALRASVRMGICQVMCDEYEQRYGGKWLPFHNPVDVSSFRKVARCDWKAGKPFKVRYGGKTGWGVRQSLIHLARAVSELRNNGFDITFEIRTAQSDDPALDGLRSLDGSVVLPLEPYESLGQSLASSDLLAIVYDFDAKSRAYSRLSMPTKAAEYMASGTAILLYGPEGHAVIEYGRKHKWGHVVSEDDPTRLEADLRELVTNHSLRESLGRSAAEVAAQNHDSQRIRSQFQETLRKGLAP